MEPPPWSLVYLHLFLNGDRIGARPAFLAPRSPVAEPPGTGETLSLLQAEVVAAARASRRPGHPYPGPGDRFAIAPFEECRKEPGALAETLAGGLHVFLVLGWFPSPAEAAAAIAGAREFLESFAGPAVEP